MSKKSESLDVGLELSIGNFYAEKAMLCRKSKKSIDDQVDEYQISALVAESIKTAISDSGLSRDNVVDGINAYFGRTKQGAASDFPTCRNPLTLNMLNNYLSKPGQYPIPSYYLFAVQHVTSGLAPARALAEAEGGHVVTGVEVECLVYGSLERQIAEARLMQKKIIGGEKTWVLN